MIRTLVYLAALGFAAAAPASELTIATWNIAWLRATPLSSAEYQQCLALNPKQREQLDDLDLKRWVCRAAEHYETLARVAAKMDADIVALQEIESVAAAERIFPRDRYQIVLTESPWIQRTGFAVRKGRVEIVKFQSYTELAVSGGDRPRYGADLIVRSPDGTVMRLLGVHLKSACHSRLLTDAQQGRYDKPGDSPPCKLLADQVKPLEAWIDARAREGTHFIVLGDFNRRLDSAVEKNEPARDAQGRQLTIWKEIDDGDPPGARLTRVTAGRSQTPNCRGGERGLPAEERAMFIDHIVLGQSLAPRLVPGSMRQWPLIEGKITRENRGELRALSDHCPLTVKLK